MATARWMTGSNRVDNFLNDRENRKSLPLKHRARGFWLLALYVPLFTIPWVLTCILARRPINAASYINQRGFTDSEVGNLRRWKNAVDVLNSIAGLITIPFLSALLAQAAVVFSQRTHDQQFMSLQDLFALADRGWSNPAALWRVARSRPAGRTSATKWAGVFLLPAAVLISLGAVQQPLYQILVRVNTIPVTTCRDTRYQYGSRNATHCTEPTSSAYRPIGVDIEPAQMDRITHNVFLRRMTSDLASISLDGEQPSLWSDHVSADTWIRARSFWSDTLDSQYRSLRFWLPGFIHGDYEIPRFFVAGISVNSTTGVLREHAMRLNSSIQCKEIDRASFPTQCPGNEPFVTSLRRKEDTNIRVCVPGEVGIFPWTRSRSRQDITEELYLDLWDGAASGEGSPAQLKNVSATIMCEAKTTRGFFELGNGMNNDIYSTMLTQWPSSEQMQEDYNDWVTTSVGSSGFVPSETDNYEGNGELVSSDSNVPSAKWRVSGPLTMSAISLFGNTSWLHSAIAYTTNTTYEDTQAGDVLSWQRLCAGMPFAGLVANDEGSYPPASSCRWADEGIAIGREPGSRDMLRLVHEWINAFAPDSTRKTQMTESLFQIGMFTASRALLTFYSPNVDANAGRLGASRGRTIYSAPGQMIQKPTLSTATVAVLTVLIVIQLLALTYLAYYIYHVPTWCSALDAIAIARIGASLGQHNILPPLGSVGKEDHLDALKHVDGLVGIVGGRGENEDSETRVPPSDTDDRESQDLELQLIHPKGSSMSVEQQIPTLQLGLGAPGVIRQDTQKVVRST